MYMYYIQNCEVFINWLRTQSLNMDLLIHPRTSVERTNIQFLAAVATTTLTATTTGCTGKKLPGLVGG